MLSQHADPEYALELLEDGSSGVAYLLKERLGDVDRLLQAIDEVRAGGSMLDPKIVSALLEAQRRRTASRLAGLTPRELEVLRLMASGKGNAAIARELTISDRSVEKHSNAIFRKLGLSEELDLNRRVAAVLFYLQRGDLDDGRARRPVAGQSRASPPPAQRRCAGVPPSALTRSRRFCRPPLRLSAAGSNPRPRRPPRSGARHPRG